MPTCPRCGTNYTDSAWACPTCEHRANLERAARDQTRNQQRLLETQLEIAETAATQFAAQKAQAEADAQHAEDLLRTLEEEGAEQRRSQHEAIANSWKLEAQSMSDRAWQLLDGGLDTEALVLARRAMDKDPGCMDAMACALRAHRRLGDSVAARTVMFKQVAMLRTDEYNDDPDMFSTVASWIRDDPETLERFAEVLREGAQRPSFLSRIRWQTPNLLDRLRGTAVTPLARDVARAALGQARDVSTSLIISAYLLDMSTTPDEADSRLMVERVNATSLSNRRALADAFGSISKDERFAPHTKAALETCVRARLEDLKPEVAASVELHARTAAEATGRPAGGLFLGWVVGIVVFYATGLVGMLLGAAAGTPSDAMMPIIMLPFVAAPVFGILAGVKVTRGIRNSKHVKAKKERYQLAKQQLAAKEDISI
jgi:uncharacterized Zn finger protein (UPF0148 family)